MAKSVATSFDMCYGCGFCKVVCPRAAIDYLYKNNDFVYAYKRLEKCVRCNLCHCICPSRGWENVHILRSESLFEVSEGLNPFEEVCFCNSNEINIRKNGTSGGMVTAVLKYLLESSIIEGVLLPKYDNRLGAKYELMTTIDEVISSQKSKYFCIPFDYPLDKIARYRKLAIVGLPCHLEALNNVFQIKPELKQILHFKIGLFCGHVQKKIFYQHLLKKERLNFHEVKKLDFRPGEWWKYDYFSVSTDRGIKTFQFRGNKYMAALIKSRLFSRSACAYCPDFTAKKSDISFGDGWHEKLKNNKEGFNYAIVRNKEAKKILEEMSTKGLVTIYRSDPKEFSGSDLLGNLLYKQLHIKKRISYLREKDKEALCGISSTGSLLDHFKISIYFRIKKIIELLEYRNILHYIWRLNYFVALIQIYLLRDVKVLRFLKKRSLQVFTKIEKK